MQGVVSGILNDNLGFQERYEQALVYGRCGSETVGET